MTSAITLFQKDRNGLNSPMCNIFNWLFKKKQQKIPGLREFASHSWKVDNWIPPASENPLLARGLDGPTQSEYSKKILFEEKQCFDCKKYYLVEKTTISSCPYCAKENLVKKGYEYHEEKWKHLSEIDKLKMSVSALKGVITKLKNRRKPR